MDRMLKVLLLVMEPWRKEDSGGNTMDNFFNGMRGVASDVGVYTNGNYSFYAKTGINFEFAKNDYKIQALEVGLSIDMVFPFIQQMAFNKAKAFYLCGYIAYDFGKRKGYH